VRGELGGYEVEAEEAGGEEREERRRAEQWVDADGKADRDAPGELARGGAATEKVDEGVDDATLEEAAGGRGRLRREVICHRDRIDCAGGVCR